MLGHFLTFLIVAAELVGSAEIVEGRPAALRRDGSGRLKIVGRPTDRSDRWTISPRS